MSDAVLDRLPRVARLEPEVFQEVGRDEGATGAALVVVLAAAFLAATGRGGGLDGILLGFAAHSLGWGLWLAAVHAGARSLGLDAGLAPQFRALGFAAAPFALGLFAGLPLLGGLVALAQWLATAAAGTVALRAVSRAEALPAAGVVLVGLALARLGVGIVF